jgi:hypothetical protein
VRIIYGSILFALCRTRWRIGNKGPHGSGISTLILRAISQRRPLLTVLKAVCSKELSSILTASGQCQQDPGLKSRRTSSWTCSGWPHRCGTRHLANGLGLFKNVQYPAATDSPHGTVADLLGV